MSNPTSLPLHAMLQLLELLPIVIFVAIYSLKGHSVDIAGITHTFDGIYDATAALMAATTAVLLVILVWKRKLEPRLLWLFAAVMVLGSATLLLHNTLFLKWKPTVISWAMGASLLGSHWFSSENLLQRMLGKQMTLPNFVYTRLCFIWAGYFFIIGGLNLIVAFNFSEAFWVHYKLWSIGFTPIIAIITAVVIMPHTKDSPSDNQNP